MEGIKGMDVVVPWGGIILALLTREQKDKEKNDETKICSIRFHHRTMCNVLESGWGVSETSRKKRPKKTR
jgi:hypothetical protein